MKKKLMILGLLCISLLSNAQESITKTEDKQDIKAVTIENIQTAQRKSIQPQSFIRKKIYTTKYFEIHYDNNSINTARKLINVADKIAETEIQFFRMQMPNNKIRVYLQDARDDTNAYSAGDGIHLYTNNNGRITPKIKDWIPYLFSHELTHELLDYKIKSTGMNKNIPLSDRIVLKASVPRWWTEGMAVLTESMISHGGGRTFDPQFMAIAIKDINEDDYKGVGPTYTNKPYEYGNSFMKFYLDTFGAEKTSEALDYYVHNKFDNIGQAYGEVVKLSSDELYTKWQKYLKNKVDESKILEGSIVLDDDSNFIQLIQDKKDTYILTRNKNKIRSSLSGIDSYDLVLQKVTFDNYGNIRTKKVYDENLSQLAGQIAINDGKLYMVKLKTSSIRGSLDQVVYMIDLKKETPEFMPEIKRAANFVTSNGKVYYSFNENESQGISTLDNKTILPSGRYQIAGLAPTENGNILVTAHIEGEMGLKIYELDVKTKEMKYLVDGKEPSKIGNTLYYINNYGKEKNNVYKTEIGSGEATKVTNVRYDTKNTFVVDNKLFYGNFAKNGYRLTRVQNNEELKETKSIATLDALQKQRDEKNSALYGQYGKNYVDSTDINLVTNEELENNDNKEIGGVFYPQFTKPDLMFASGGLALIVPSSNNKDMLVLYGSPMDLYEYGGDKPVFSFDSSEANQTTYNGLNSLYVHQFSEPTLSKTTIGWSHSENIAKNDDKKNSTKVIKKHLRRDDLIVQTPFRSDYIDMDFTLSTDFQGDFFGSDSHYQKLDSYFGIGSYQNGLFYDSLIKIGDINKNGEFYKGNYGQDTYYLDTNLKAFLPFLEELSFLDINLKQYTSTGQFSSDSLYNPNTTNEDKFNQYTNIAIRNTYSASDIYGDFKHTVAIEKGSKWGKVYLKGIEFKLGYSYVTYNDKDYKGNGGSTRVSGVGINPSIVLNGNIFNDSGEFKLGVGHVFAESFTKHERVRGDKDYAIISLLF